MAGPCGRKRCWEMGPLREAGHGWDEAGCPGHMQLESR